MSDAQKIEMIENTKKMIEAQVEEAEQARTQYITRMDKVMALGTQAEDVRQACRLMVNLDNLYV